MKVKRAGSNEGFEAPLAKKAKALPTNDTGDQQENGHQETEEQLFPSIEDQQDKKGRKRKRVRVKKLRQDISKQLEFYFCDANLRKDRYMKELVAAGQDGWVNVSEFAKFNKIKSLLDKKGIDHVEIAKAAKDSELLEVSSDMSKVRRNLEKFPVEDKDPETVDECTIYVEGLQPSATIDSVRCLFSEFGPIEYVSLPRKPTGEHKGFAFVEFSTRTGAENACKFHNLQTGGRGFHFAAEDEKMVGSTKPELTPIIQVLSKKEWMQYKQQYLKLRKESAKLTKKFLSTFASPADPNSRSHPKRQANAHGDPADPANGDPPDPENGDPSDLAENRAAANVEPGGDLHFVEGCIVKLEAESPLLKPSKAALRAVPDVVYVDMMENDPIAYLRFSSPEQAQKFVEGKIELADIKLKLKLILEGQEEQLYWARVESMRVNKRERGREKQRGREKLRGRYEKHVAIQEKKVLNKRIVFDD